LLLRACVHVEGAWHSVEEAAPKYARAKSFNT